MKTVVLALLLCGCGSAPGPTCAVDAASLNGTAYITSANCSDPSAYPIPAATKVTNGNAFGNPVRVVSGDSCDVVMLLDVPPCTFQLEMTTK
jgi:hypothetical protein